MGDILTAGGALSMVVLGIGAFGVLVTLMLGGLAFTKRRVPLAFFAFLPMMVVGVGALGAWSGAGGIYTELSAAEIDAVPGAAMAGVWDSLTIDWFSRWVAAFVFAAAAWGASLGAIAAGDDTQWTPVSGVFAALVALIGGLAIAVYGIQAGVGQQGTIMAVLIVFAGLGVSIGSFKRALDEQAQRVAGMRFASATCAFLAISFGAGALFMGSRMDILGVGGHLEQATDLIAAIAMWGELAAPVITLGWAAIFVGAVIAFFGFFYELGEVVERFTLVDVFATMLLMGFVGTLRMVEHSSTDGLFAIGSNAPAAQLFPSFGADLGAALISIEKETTSVNPGDGGFGDVFVYQEEMWTRRFAWNGSGWDEDTKIHEGFMRLGTPMDEITVSGDRRPLFAIGSGEEAGILMSALEKVPNGKALLMLRAFEVKEDVEVPDELAHLQVTYLPIEIGDGADFETEPWGDAGKRFVNWGPVRWFGEADGEEPLVYYPGVFESTEATGINVYVEERSRVKGIIGSCLPVLMELEGEKEVVRSDKFCHLYNGTVDETRLEAMAAWEVPAMMVDADSAGDEERDIFKSTLFTSLSIEHREGDQIDPQIVIDRLMREVAGIEYCVNELLEEGEEELEGKMMLEVYITKRGKIGEMKVHEKSKMTTPGAARCFAKRVKTAKVEWPEDWEAPENPDPEDEKWEAPPMPTFDVLLELKAPPEA